MMRALILLVALALSACGGMEAATGIRDPFGTPQPFRGTGDQALVAGIVEERPVFIGPVSGLAPDAENAMRAAITAAAAEMDVLATDVAMPAGGLTFSGAATGESVAFALDDGSARVAAFSVQGDAALIPMLAARRLAEAMGRFGGVPAATAAAAAANAPLIFVREVTGPSQAITAPLKRAVHDRLAEMGARMSEGPAEGAYVVTGAVTFEENSGRTQVTLVWKAYAPDGRDLGNATQSNAIPSATVRDNWPETATMAGRAAAGSVAQIIASDFNKPAS